MTLHVTCPECGAGLGARAEVDYFETRCACCGARFAVQRDPESGICEAYPAAKRWALPAGISGILP